MYYVSIAQSAEQQTLNLWVLGSSPSGDTKSKLKVGLGLLFLYLEIRYFPLVRKNTMLLQQDNENTLMTQVISLDVEKPNKYNGFFLVRMGPENGLFKQV